MAPEDLQAGLQQVYAQQTDGMSSNTWAVAAHCSPGHLPCHPQPPLPARSKEGLLSLFVHSQEAAAAQCQPVLSCAGQARGMHPLLWMGLAGISSRF